MKLDDQIKSLLDKSADTPFFSAGVGGKDMEYIYIEDVKGIFKKNKWNYEWK